MIVHPYPFQGDDTQKVYLQSRRFLALLHEHGISVTLPDGFRSNTKFYPDYGSTMTTVEIFPDISTSEELEVVEQVHADVTDGAKPEPPEVDEALRLERGHRLELFQDTDGWLLVDCHEDQRQVVFRNIPDSSVLDSLRHYLKRDPGDDFDPFLDPGDDLP